MCIMFIPAEPTLEQQRETFYVSMISLSHVKLQNYRTYRRNQHEALSMTDRLAFVLDNTAS